MAFLMVFYDLKYLAEFDEQQMQLSSLLSFRLIDLVYEKINPPFKRDSENSNLHS
jgi:hypothetical protein